ncbi:MAG TPA: sulfur carrier protein ThiS [Burkholderiaceae bacterium]|jgi:sulfur carrier protein|nr:sulfur carrier protein ThiS [Burkholderiaceae bacterium]
MIAIELNGEPRTITAGQRVQELIASLALSNQSLAVAINREIVPRHLWAQRELQAQDRVDIVRAIGGG